MAQPAHNAHDGAPLSWTYEGAYKEDNDGGFANLCIAKPGQKLRHEMFGVCILLGAGRAKGNLSVK
eukprot:3741258-Pleurochrysis_carterae.AAC.1